MVRNKYPDLDFEQFTQVYNLENEKMAIVMQLVIQKLTQANAKGTDIVEDVLSKADLKEVLNVAEQFQNSETMKTSNRPNKMKPSAIEVLLWLSFTGIVLAGMPDCRAMTI
jgi:hypothetical protein